MLNRFKIRYIDYSIYMRSIKIYRKHFVERLAKKTECTQKSLHFEF